MIDLKKIKKRVSSKYKSLGTVFANAIDILSEAIKTAATDGKHILCNPKFFESLTEKERETVYAHEIFHIALDHIHRSEGKDQDVWNYATDAVINAQLKRDGYPIPKGGIDEDEAYNYSAEGYYEKLMNDPDKKDKIKKDKTKKGFDDHGEWSEAVEKIKKEQEQKEITPINEREFFDQLRHERAEELKKEKKNLVEELKKMRENIEHRKIEKIGNSKPRVDWKQELEDTFAQDFDWSYLYPVIEDDIIRPTIEEIKRGEVEIVLDTSISVSKNLLRNFLRACKNIFKTANIKVGCFDDQFYGFKVVRTERDIDQLSLPGGGGTDFDVAVNAFTNTIPTKIIFTDGDADMPKEYCNAIWIVFGSKKIQPKGGKVIYIPDEQLKDLNFSRDVQSESRKR